MLFELKRNSFNQGYFIRTTLLKLGHHKYLFAYATHYMVLDDEAITIFNQEFSALYTAFHKGKSQTLPELPLQYADYAAWENKCFESNKEPSYGEEKLAKLTGSQLPYDIAIPAENFPEISNYRLEFGKEIGTAILLLSKKQKTTPFIILMASLQMLMHRLTHKDIIITLTPFRYRTKKEFKRILGHFARPMYFCTDLSGDPSFSELLERTQESASEFYQNSINIHYSKKVWLDLINPNENSFFQYSGLDFTEAEALEPRLELSDVKSVYEKDYLFFEILAHFYLQLALHEERLFGIYTHCTKLFKPETAHRIICQFQKILLEVTQNPKQNISQISLSVDNNYPEHNFNKYSKWDFSGSTR